MAWSYDGQRVATGTELKGVRVWPVTPSSSSGRGMYANTPSPHAVTIESSSIALPSRGVSPHTGHVGTLAFSPAPDAAHILVSGCKGAKGGSVIAVWDVRSPAGPLATFKIPGDVLHLAFHPSGSHFAAVCPRSIRDEVVFFRQTETGWVQREDVMLGGLGIDVGVDEVSQTSFRMVG
jgi:THO complex subunit 3